MTYCIICTVSDFYHHVILEKRLHNQTVQSFSASPGDHCFGVAQLQFPMENDGHGDMDVSESMVP